MTGMRRGEALGLAWSQIDWEKGQLRVERCLKDVHHGDPVFGPPKTEASRRTVTLDPGTLAALRTLRTEQARERLLHGEGYTDFDLVFCKPDGNPLHPDRTLRKFKDLAAQCKVPVIRLHDMRHTNATLLLETGIHSHVVQERLGHSHVSITLSIYAHITKQMDDEAANRIASLLG
jgi:integrase